jgi:type I restriction enzyme S subunit
MKLSINQNGWAITRLEDIATKITKGATPTTYGYSFQKTGINFLKVENISEGRVNLKSITDFIGEDAHKFLSKSQLSINDILFSIAGTIGETCIIREEHLPANTNQALAIIKGTDAVIIPKLLQLQLQVFVAKVKLKARGGAMNNVSLEDLKKMLIYIPPLAEQHRIVAKIEELFSSLDKGIESLKTAQAQLKVYRQAVLKWAFEGKLTNPNVKDGELPEGWKWKKISELGEIVTGTTPSKKNPEFYGEEYPFYKPTDLEAGENVIKSTDGLSNLGIKKSRYAPEFSTLVTCIGATIGKTGFIKKGGGFNQQINAIIPNSSVVSKYVYYQAIAPKFQEQIKENASATTLPILNKGRFEILEMVVCNKSEQQRIVSEIESRLSVCDKIEESIATALQQAEALRQSILKKAFEGKLVPQNPNDEPASVLLERIKAEREKNKKKPKASNRHKKERLSNDAEGITRL